MPQDQVPPPKTTRANGVATREKILRAAEVLFGQHGFDAVSLRDITSGAGVTLALASYHFGTKERMFEEVVATRAAILGAERAARLAALQNPSVREIVDAFMGPLFDKAAQKGEGWHSHFQVISRLGDGARWLDLLARHYDGTAQLFIAALRRALPQADPNILVRCFTMMLPVMLSTVSQHRRADRLSDGAVSAADMSRSYPALLDFVTAGILGAAQG